MLSHLALRAAASYSQIETKPASLEKKKCFSLERISPLNAAGAVMVLHYNFAWVVSELNH